MAFSKAKSYLIFRIFNQPILAKIDANLFEETEINFSELVGIERAHPLNDIYIDLSFLNSDK